MRYYLILFMSLLTMRGMAQDSEAQKLIKKGDVLAEHGLFVDAINKYEQALAFDKNSAKARYEMAYAYLKLKKWDDALYYSRMVMAKDNPYKVDALLVYGSVLSHKGKHKQVVKAFNKALKDNPTQPLLHYNLALSYKAMGQLDLAVEAVQKSLRYNKTLVEAHQLLADLMKEKSEVLKSMLPLYYTLLIEESKLEKEKLLKQIQVLWYAALVQKEKAPAKYSKHSRESGLEIMAASLRDIALKGKESTEQEPDQLVAQTIGLLELLNEKQSGELDFFDIYYIDFFMALHQAGHAESFAWYICNSVYSVEVLNWLAANKGRFQSFMEWMELQQ